MVTDQTKNRPQAALPTRKTRFLKRSLSGWSRWLHIYLSILSFAVLLFFAITGITLNHTEWFNNQLRSTQHKGKLSMAWVQGTDTNSLKRLEIVEYLRRTENIHGYLSDFLPDDYQVTLAFKGPGYAADVFINRETGDYEINKTESGLVGIANDLHKGRDSGKAWSLFIDISAGLMILVSLTGLLLIFFLKKKRTSGLLLLALGLFLAWLVYILWVP